MFYDNLKSLCDSKGLKITTVVTECGGALGSISKWRNGANPNSDIVIKLSLHLGVTTDYLLLGKSTIEKTNIELKTDEQELLENYRQLAGDDKKEVSVRAEELANGIASETNENRQEIFKSVQYNDLREKEMLMLFRSLSEHEQERLIGRAELLVEQAKFEENAG